MTVAVMQALATGLPVIATRHSAFPDQVIDGKNGYLVDEGDYRALAERIQFLMDHPQQWAEMGRFGRSHVKSAYDAGVLMDRQVACYQELIQNA